MPRPDDGYATPAATVISAAISMVVVALMTRTLSDMHLAQSELTRAKVDYALSSAQNVAMLAIATSSQPPPYRWTIASLGQAYDVIAEPERAKMSPQAFATLSDAAVSAFAVQDVASLRVRLGSVMIGPDLIWMADQDAAATWQSCAPAVVSPFGQATVLTPPSYVDPISGKQSGNWRAGEVWRIQVTEQDGWRDERVVRFTGNGLKPAAVLGRRVSRGWKGAQTCQSLFELGFRA